MGIYVYKLTLSLLLPGHDLPFLVALEAANYRGPLPFG